MKVLIFYFFLFASEKSEAQEIKIDVKGLKDTTYYLLVLHGEKLFYADTAQAQKGLVKFDGSKHEPGMYGVFSSGIIHAGFEYTGEKIYVKRD